MTAVISGIERGQSFLDSYAERLAGPKADPERYQLLDRDGIASMPVLRWLVKSLVLREGLAVIFGAPGTAKTFWTLLFLACVASGCDFFGLPVNQAPVLYVCLEGEGGIQRRVKALESVFGLLPDSFKFLLQSFDIRKASDRADLIAAARSAGVVGGVVCIDTLNRSAPGADENDSSSMGEIIAGAKQIQNELGGLLVFVAHSGKDASKGIRGHSSLHAALDTVIELTRRDGRREWSISKSKDGEDSLSHAFRLDVVEVGTDEDGEPITSCVVIPEENAGGAVRRVLSPKSGNQRIVWDALGEMLKASPHYGKAGAAPTRPCVRLEDAIEKIRARLVCDPKRQTERTRSAITGLISNGQIIHREGWLWLA